MIRSGLLIQRRAEFEEGYPSDYTDSIVKRTARPYVQTEIDTTLPVSNFAKPSYNPDKSVFYDDIFSKRVTPDESLYLYQKFLSAVKDFTSTVRPLVPSTVGGSILPVSQFPPSDNSGGNGGGDDDGGGDSGGGPSLPPLLSAGSELDSVMSSGSSFPEIDLLEKEELQSADIFYNLPGSFTMNRYGEVRDDYDDTSFRSIHDKIGDWLVGYEEQGKYVYDETRRAYKSTTVAKSMTASTGETLKTLSNQLEEIDNDAAIQQAIQKLSRLYPTVEPLNQKLYDEIRAIGSEIPEASTERIRDTFENLREIRPLLSEHDKKVIDTGLEFIRAFHKIPYNRRREFLNTVTSNELFQLRSVLTFLNPYDDTSMPDILIQESQVAPKLPRLYLRELDESIKVNHLESGRVGKRMALDSGGRVGKRLKQTEFGMSSGDRVRRPAYAPNNATPGIDRELPPKITTDVPKRIGPMASKIRSLQPMDQRIPIVREQRSILAERKREERMRKRRG